LVNVNHLLNISFYIFVLIANSWWRSARWDPSWSSAIRS